ncbi:HrpJ domain-containing protein [Erwinia piriflorinigrans]|uniref:Protein mxiC n=1 Tax=Erwinia piriflorinigrans CFBP 5888 TaxID=1161919 RepID=V5Z7Z0_9GAMM|nr:HrpJ domain-containing protein [Erwinia piriflorinigrans]CCG87064.1 Protein mxiC [Erwinia piriflorinigrans CFBP 5888]
MARISPFNYTDNSAHRRQDSEKMYTRSSTKHNDHVQPINHDENIINAAEELADLFSSLGRASKTGRKNDNSYSDTGSEILEENADEKIYTIMTRVAKSQNSASILNFARQLFSNDWDLMQALRELLLSKNLSEFLKKKIKKAIDDLMKFSDLKKLNSSANVGDVAKRFSQCTNNNGLSAKELRDSYLKYLDYELPAIFIYQDWIDVYGFSNRKIMLSFILTALISDMKSTEPGIHSHEFGPLSARIIDARTLNSLDNKLIVNFNNSAYSSTTKNSKAALNAEGVLNIYLMGLINPGELVTAYGGFFNDFSSKRAIRQQATVVQLIRRTFDVTPDYLYARSDCHEKFYSFLTSVQQSLYIKEVALFKVAGKYV